MAALVAATESNEDPCGTTTAVTLGDAVAVADAVGIVDAVGVDVTYRKPSAAAFVAAMLSIIDPYAASTAVVVGVFVPVCVGVPVAVPVTVMVA